MVGVRMSEDLQAEIRTWARKQEDQPPLAAAIRRLVEMALASSGKRQARYHEKTAAKARDLASKTLDRLIDPDASAEERAVRKRRLLKGPSVFRNLRVDQDK
jgi:hypothetical protein